MAVFIMAIFGKPKFMCDNCGRKFVENPTKKIISQEAWNLEEGIL
jgi:hypothetical protein